MDLQAKHTKDSLTISVCDARLDALVAISFKEQMRLCTADGTGRVILDLSQVTFIDSSGLGAVVAVMKLLGPDRPLELAGLSPNVAKVFRLTRMDKVFTIHAAQETPLALRATG